MIEQGFPTLKIDARFLGTFEIKANDCLIGNLGTQKNRALCAYLILENEKVHPRSEVAGLFWPDVPEEMALHNLRQALSGLRKAFDLCGGGEVFTATREYIGFREDTRISTDVDQFQNEIGLMLEKFHRQPGKGFPISRLKRVLSLYKGELLSTISLADAGLFSDWLVLRREALNRMAVEGCSLLLRFSENRGEWGEAARAAEQLVKLAPWDENAHSRFIDALLQLAQGSAALAHYQAAERYLRVELEMEPGSQLKKSHADIQQFFSSGRSEPEHKPVAISVPRYSTGFVGRIQELETLEDWISDPNCHVITITGPGGSGKTRLAARLAEDQYMLFSGGVFFVSIAACAGKDVIVAKILEGVSSQGEGSADPLQELLKWAGNRRSLLILDNVENCGEVAEIAAKLIEASAHLVLVLTSYTRLDLIGEKVYALKGLSTRGGSGSEAAHLFLSHLQNESHSESQTEEFLENVVRICSLVDSLPLAIDLAAGQVKRITSAELLAELTASMDILNSRAANLPDRHRSIAASFENCWNHLTPRHQKNLALLTVFDSPFTLEAALQVCGVSSTEVRDLANQSLLTWDAGEYYRFHRAVRQYANEKLSLDTAAMRQVGETHAHYFYKGLLDDHASSRREGILQFLANFTNFAADIEKAIRHLISVGDWELVTKIIHPVYCYYEARGLYRYGSTLLQNLASLCPKSREDARCYARFTARAASLLISTQQFAGVQGMLDLALENARSEEDRSEESFCLNILAKQAAVKKSSGVSLEYAEKAFIVAHQAGNRWEEVHSFYNQGYALINLGEITRAEQVLSACRVACEELGDWRRQSKVLNVLADTECNRGNFDQALDYYKEAYDLAEKLENRFSQSLVLNNIGTAHFSKKNYEKAEEAYQKSLQVCREIDDREGEAIALSNLGELYADKKDFKNGVEFNRQALAISLEIGSEWGEMSARVVLALCYRESSDFPAAVDEVLVVLPRALELGFIYFFNRGVVEAGWLLLHCGRTGCLRQIISQIVNDDESDDWICSKAKELLAEIPAGADVNTKDLTRETMRDFLVKELRAEWL